MNRRTFLLAAATAGATSGCTALGLYPRERGFTAAELQDRIAKRFPWKRNYPLFALELTNPLVRLENERNRIAVAFDASLSSPLFGKPFNGRGTLSGVPRYVPDSQSFLLGDLALDTLDVPGVPRAAADELRRMAGAIAREALDGVPLYTLRPEDGRYLGQQLEPESVRVENDRLVLRVKPKK